MIRSFTLLKGIKGFYKQVENKCSGVTVFVKKVILVIREQIIRTLCFDNITLTLKIRKLLSAQNKHKFLEDFETLRHSLRTGAKHLIMGDFNIDTLVSNKACESFRNMFETMGLKQLDIGSPTKKKQKQKTLVLTMF